MTRFKLEVERLREQVDELTRERDNALWDANQVATLTRERDEARRLLAEWLAGPMSDAQYDAGLGRRTRAALAEIDGGAGEP